MIRKRAAKLVGLVLAGIFPLVGVLDARLSPGPPQMPRIQASPKTNDEDLRFFTGTISSLNGKYVLQGGYTKGPYLLDDQERAKEYEGKHVRVTGVLEVTSKVIHVRSIEEAAA